MLKSEFLEMMHQDLKTKKDEELKNLLLCFEEVLKDYPSYTEIDSIKSVEVCYTRMYEYAKKNARNGRFCFSPTATKKFIINYLELENQVAHSSGRIPVSNDDPAFVKLEDFI